MSMKQRLGSWTRRVRLEDPAKKAWVEARMVGERLQWLCCGRPEPSAAIVIASSGRSGSTWLSDILSAVPGTQGIFEPLHPAFSPEVRRLTGWGCERRTRSHYVSMKCGNPEWYPFLHRVLTGQVRNYLTDYVRSSYFPRRYVVKLIRGNLLLGYLYGAFHPKILYLVRHPCAVVSSRLRVKWRASVEDILCQEHLVADYLRPWVDAIRRERDSVGVHAVWWAVENAVAEQELRAVPHRTVYYEKLCLQPESEICSILSWMGLPNEQVPHEVLSRSSRVSSRKDPAVSAMDRLSSWTRDLSEGDQRRILKWAHRMDLTMYGTGILPLTMADISASGST